jgi:hypothetical protein
VKKQKQIACCGTAAAQDASESARLQKLEEAVTQLQAENQQLKGQIQTEAAGPMTGVPEGKFDISSSVTSIQLFGDLMIVTVSTRERPRDEMPGT